jgi:adenylate cyclase
MALEIERKFLLANERWKTLVDASYTLTQGYLSTNPTSTTRVRIKAGIATLTIKSKNTGIRRSEFEYQIPTEDAQELLALCDGPLIQKTRHTIAVDNHTWEIDEFSGDNSGLVVAEIELSAENEVFIKPEWVGTEVSDDPRYYNSNLVKHPYSLWEKNIF